MEALGHLELKKKKVRKHQDKDCAPGSEGSELSDHQYPQPQPVLYYIEMVSGVYFRFLFSDSLDVLPDFVADEASEGVDALARAAGHVSRLGDLAKEAWRGKKHTMWYIP